MRRRVLRLPSARRDVAVFAIVMLFHFAAASRAVGSGWSVLPTSPMENFRHQDIAVIGSDKCWIVAGTGLVHKTSDGGATWQHAATFPAYLRSVGFADSLRGWTGSLTSSAPLFDTTDGGATWTEVTNIPEPEPLGICGLSVVNASTVYGCGVYYGPARVIKTTNGGATWSSMDMSAYASTLIDCYFVSPDTGFVVGGIGTPFADSTRAVVIATTNGGTTWETRFTGILAKEWCWKISFPTRAVGYISLQRTSAPVGFLKTTDGGASWERKPFLEPFFFYGEQGIGFATETVGWIGGSGVLYGTTDGGETWQQETWGTNLNRFRFVNSGLGYAVGNRVYKYDVNDPTSVADGEGPLGSPLVGFAPTGMTSIGALLFQNAPNPFRSSTSVDYALEAPGEVHLAVYDLLGRRVATLVDARLSAGTHRTLWDGTDGSGRDAASGTYVYRLQIDGQQDAQRVRRMTLLR
ncbi:MAG: FlgD immunoglobulin-like domain containing protein [bacterium]